MKDVSFLALLRSLVVVISVAADEEVDLLLKV